MGGLGVGGKAYLWDTLTPGLVAYDGFSVCHIAALLPCPMGAVPATPYPMDIPGRVVGTYTGLDPPATAAAAAWKNNVQL